MMRKVTLISILLLGCLLEAFPQQNPLYSQFMTNPFLINPALAGTYPYYQIMLNSRVQWVGFTDAPMTNVISMYGPTVKKPMGLGGYIMYDVYGATSITLIKLSYAYNYAISENLKISMGLALGLKQFKISGNMTIADPGDKTYQPGYTFTKLYPDASWGAYLYSSTYHIGLAITNLFGNKVEYGIDTVTNLSKLKQNFYLHGGYKYNVSRELSIEPTVVFKKITATPVQMDLDVRAWYGKRQWDRTKLWGGVSYRTGDAISILLGIIYQRKIEFGYSYDIGINKLRGYNSGSHEIMIGFKFNDIKEY
jgi:type IX secretion system PorP/SprF family membrane protein